MTRWEVEMLNISEISWTEELMVTQLVKPHRHKHNATKPPGNIERDGTLVEWTIIEKINAATATLSDDENTTMINVQILKAGV